MLKLISISGKSKLVDTSLGREDLEKMSSEIPEDGFYEVVLYEWVDYTLEIESSIKDAHEVLGRILINNKAGALKEITSYSFNDSTTQFYKHLFTLRFENHIGKSSIIIKEDSSEVKYNFEVSSKKLENTIGFRTFYNNLLNYLHNHFSELPYREDDLTYFNTFSSDTESSDFFKLFFYKFNYDKFEEALNTILSTPHSVLYQDEAFIPFEDVKEIDEDSIISILHNPDKLTKSKRYSLPGSNGFMPEEINSYRLENTFDTLENRFVKYFIKMLLFELTRLNGAYRKNEYIVLFEEILHSVVFSDVSDIDSLPDNSILLQKRTGYAELFGLYNEFLFSYRPGLEDLYKSIDNHNVAKMYEWFCFFRLVRSFSNNKVEFSFKTPEDLKNNAYAAFKFNNHLYKLYYNKEFSSSSGSYSVTLRPDFSLFDAECDRLLGVFDAKFKLDKQLIDRITLNDSEEDTSQETIATKADIYKMHTYRDALKDCEFAIICYPGNNNNLYSCNKRKSELDLSILSNLNIMFEEGESGTGFLEFIPK